MKEHWLSIWSQIECAFVNNSMWPINSHIFYLWHRFIASPCARSLHIQPGVLRQAQPNAVLEKVFTSITKVCPLSFSCYKACMYRKQCMWDYRAGNMGVRNTNNTVNILLFFLPKNDAWLPKEKYSPGIVIGITRMHLAMENLALTTVGKKSFLYGLTCFTLYIQKLISYHNIFFLKSRRNTTTNVKKQVVPERYKQHKTSKSQ